MFSQVKCNLTPIERNTAGQSWWAAHTPVYIVSLVSQVWLEMRFLHHPQGRTEWQTHTALSLHTRTLQWIHQPKLQKCTLRLLFANNPNEILSFLIRGRAKRERLCDISYDLLGRTTASINYLNVFQRFKDQIWDLLNLCCGWRGCTGWEHSNFPL